MIPIPTIRIRPVLCLALLLPVLSLVGCGGGTGGHDTDQASANETAGDHPAPPDDWSLPVIDAKGFDELREKAAALGQVLVVDCWATWCGSCKAMFPLLHEAMAKRGDKVSLVSFSYDENEPGGEDYIAKAQDYLVEQHAWETGYIVDPAAKDAIRAATSEKWDGGTLPAVFVFGPDGKLVFELDELRGEPADWVKAIADAADQAARGSAEGSPAQ